MADSNFPGCILHASRPDILNAFRSELKDSGVDPILTPETVEDSVVELVKYPDALLVLDFQIGVKMVHQVLRAVQNPLQMAIRPILLFSQESVEGLEGLAAEYSVSHLHTGQLTPNVMKDILVQIAQSEGYTQDVRDAFKLVADARQRKDWQLAGNILEESFKKNPREQRICVELAENYFCLGNYDKVEDLLKVAFAGDSEDPREINLVGRVLMARGEYDKASLVLQKAKLINPFNIDRIIDLGESYLEMNKFYKAEKTFREAVDYGSKESKALGGLGKSLLALGKINDALIYLRQLSGDREMASVFNNSAILCMRAGKYEEGMRLYQVALKTVGEDKEVQSKLAFNMGIGYHRHQDDANAHKAFRAAVVFDDKNTKALANYKNLSQTFGEAEVPLEASEVLNYLLEMDIAASGALVEPQKAEVYDDDSDLGGKETDEQIDEAS